MLNVNFYDFAAYHNNLNLVYEIVDVGGLHVALHGLEHKYYYWNHLKKFVGKMNLDLAKLISKK